MTVATREPEWTDEEFLTLLRNLDRTDEDLSRMLGRSRGAIGTVRAGLVAYASGSTQNTLLSDYMRDLLRGREHYLEKLQKT